MIFLHQQFSNLAATYIVQYLIRKFDYEMTASIVTKVPKVLCLGKSIFIRTVVPVSRYFYYSLDLS